MLVIPAHYNSARILAIDPGLHHTGMAILEFDTRTGVISRIQANTFNTDRLRQYTGLDEEISGVKRVLIQRLCMTATAMIREHDPWAVACEAPFYNRFRPNAFGVLTEVVANVSMACSLSNPYIPFELLAPQLVKKSIGTAGKKGKEPVAIALKSIPEIANAMTVSIDSLDEHSIDAIAVGYCMLKFRLFV